MRAEMILTLHNKLKLISKEDRRVYFDAVGAHMFHGLSEDLKNLTDDQLSIMMALPALAVKQGHLEKLSTPEERGRATIFASHLSEDSKFVGKIKEQLERFGIDLFVAHVSVESGARWSEKIQNALSQSDAGVAFIRSSFKESDWCDQEVGWLLGREIPVLPLSLDGTQPYGPLGLFQARISTTPDSTEEITLPGEERTRDSAFANSIHILEWFARNLSDDSSEELLIRALENSDCFVATRILFAILSNRRVLSEAGKKRLMDAIPTNTQLSNANVHQGIRGYIGFEQALESLEVRM